MKNQTRSISGRWPVASGQGVGVSCRVSRSRDARRSSFGFTLVELLVTITIIGILAGMVLGVLRSARETGRESATKATIAKLNNIIMTRYESYLTRRVPVAIPAGTNPKTAAQIRLDSVRDLMRMEMPDCVSDILSGPYSSYSWCTGAGSITSCIPEPTLHSMYKSYEPTDEVCPSAQCLYLIVSIGNPEAMEQFHQNEIGTVSGTISNGSTVTRPVFIDGWGRPIMWFRCAPGYSNCPANGFNGASEIQSGVATDTDVDISSDSGVARWKASSTPGKKTLLADHDPFDPRKSDLSAFQLFPLIYSAGPDGQYGLDRINGYSWSNSKGNPFDSNYNTRGKPTNEANDKTTAVGCHLDNITNHQ
ncbi:MAG: type II secretion system protein [Thermoguttaceae bacterium]